MVVEAFNIAGTKIAPGSRARVEIPLPPLSLGSSVSMPLTVIHGKQAGPCLFVSAAVHGDELNGTEIIRRLLDQPELEEITGTLIAVPIVNVYGVISAAF